MNNEAKMQQIVSAFVGSVEWFVCHEALFERGMEFVARVDGELRGVLVKQETAGKVFYRVSPRIAPHEGYSYYTVKPMERRDMLAVVGWEELRLKRQMFTDAERAEWEELGRKQTETEQLRAQEREKEERRRELDELQRLKEKYQK